MRNKSATTHSVQVALWAPRGSSPHSLPVRPQLHRRVLASLPCHRGSHCLVCALTQEMLPPGSHTGFSGLHLPFIGFTFTTERYV